MWWDCRRRGSQEEEIWHWENGKMMGNGGHVIFSGENDDERGC